jgi:hypothetical protein
LNTLKRKNVWRPTKSYRCYEQPDSGNYRLEKMLEKELVFLNDFEWDQSGKWCSWQYFKNFLEGGSLPIGRPKNRGGDVDFQLDSPVLGTCPSPILLFSRQGSNMAINQYEVDQINTRVVYMKFTAQIQKDRVQRKVKECPHCAAKLYLEGRPAGAATAAAPVENPQGASRSRSPRRAVLPERMH